MNEQLWGLQQAFIYEQEEEIIDEGIVEAQPQGKSFLKLIKQLLFSLRKRKAKRAGQSQVQSGHWQKQKQSI